MQTIGFVGVGKIGTQIAKHLLAAGYEVLGYRRSSLAEFEKTGGRQRNRQPRSPNTQTLYFLACRVAKAPSTRSSMGRVGW